MTKELDNYNRQKILRNYRNNVLIIWKFFLIVFFVGNSAGTSSAELSPSTTCLDETSKGYMERFKESITIPDAKIMERIKTLMVLKTNTGMHNNDCVHVNTNTSAPLQTGGYNSGYRSVLDLPLTKFLLGKTTIQAEEFKQKYLEIYAAAGIIKEGNDFKDENQNPMYPGILSETTETKLIVAMGGGTEAVKSTLTKLDQLDFKKLDKVFLAIQKGFNVIMLKIPALLLFLMFVLQVVWYSIVFVIDREKAEKINLVGQILKMMVFFIILLFYKPIVIFLISFSNLLAYSMIGPQDQERLMAFITQFMVFTPAGGDTFYHTVASFVRMFAQISLYIMFISRDILLAVTVLIGGLCISLGYFSIYDDDEIFRKYLSGWAQALVKYLLWGPLMVIAILAISVVVALSQTGNISDSAVLIVAISAVYLVKKLPKIADDMSGAVLMSALSEAGLSQFKKLMGNSMEKLGTKIAGGIRGQIYQSLKELLDSFFNGRRKRRDRNSS